MKEGNDRVYCLVAERRHVITTALVAKKPEKPQQGGRLREQAARMIEEAEAEAVGDDKARCRLLAGCRHETMMISLGTRSPRSPRPPPGTSCTPCAKSAVCETVREPNGAARLPFIRRPAVLIGGLLALMHATLSP